ncbi:MAG TPA: cell division protein FtsZ [archaeon]|nr:cell division protein FtsZ [archaeon]
MEGLVFINSRENDNELHGKRGGIALKTIVEKAVKKAKEESSRKKKITIAGKGEEDLEKILKECGAVIKVFGCGGAGNNTLGRIQEVGIHGIESIALNTDAQQLSGTTADKKLLIGRELTQGLGAGSNPDVGEAAARESIEDIARLMKGADLVFITCGLGGGTGTGSAPVVAEVAKDLEALSVAVVTLPFTVEGKRRMENALQGLAKLRKACDTIILIPNDKLLEVAPDLPIKSAFKVADEILTNAVKGTTELITKPGLINLDFADLRTILNRCGPAMIGLGESARDSKIESRALDAVENALTSPLLDVDISEASRALVNVTGGTDMTLKEAEMVVEAVASKIHPSAHIIWGAMIDDNLSKSGIQAMVIIGGGRIPYLEMLEGGEYDEAKGKKGGKADLDIEYV